MFENLQFCCKQHNKILEQTGLKSKGSFPRNIPEKTLASGQFDPRLISLSLISALPSLVFLDVHSGFTLLVMKFQGLTSMHHQTLYRKNRIPSQHLFRRSLCPRSPSKQLFARYWLSWVMFPSHSSHWLPSLPEWFLMGALLS